MFSGDEAGLHSKIRDIFEQAKAAAGGSLGRPSVYGFTMGFSKQGEPIIEEFGDTSAYGIEGFVEPITDVIEAHDLVSVISELPGVTKADIDLRVTEGKVNIKCDTQYRKYLKQVKLSTKVDPTSTTARFNNGVLEVILKRVDEIIPGTKVKVD